MTDNAFSYPEKAELRQRSNAVLAEALRHWRNIDIARMLNTTPQVISNVKAGRQFFLPMQIDILLDRLKQFGVNQEDLPMDTTIRQSQSIAVSNSATKYGAIRFRDAVMKAILANENLDKLVKMEVIQIVLETPLESGE